MNTDSATPPGRLGAVWNDSPGRSENTLRLRQSFQSARPISGSPCGPSRSRVKSMRPAHVVVERRLGAVGVVPRHGLVEDRAVAGLLDVGGDGEDQPQRVVVEPAADVVVAALRERLVLVVRAAVGSCVAAMSRIRSRARLRDHVDEAEQVLVRVAEAHPAPDPGLEHRGRARQVERHHALVRVPGVDHAVDVLVAGRHLEGRRAARPTRPRSAARSASTWPGPPVALDRRPARATCPARS